MKRILTILFTVCSLWTTAQTTNPIATRFTKGVLTPNTSTAPFLGQGSLWYDPIGTRFKGYNGVSWDSFAYLSDVTGAYLPLSGGTLTGGLIGTTGDFSGALSASNLSGTNTGDQTTIPALTTARTIWGQSFNGTANISGAFSGATTGLFSTSVQVPKIGLGATPSNIANFYNATNITGGTTAIGQWLNTTVQPDVTGAVYGYRSDIGTQATTFTLTSLFHNTSRQGTFGAGSSVTSQYGYYADATLIGATNDYGFYGNIPAGTNQWNSYMNGTALNYMNGSLLIGSATDNGQKLQVTGRIRVSQGLSGTAGTDSLVVHDNTSKELKLISPTFYNQTLSLGTTPGNIVLSGSGGNVSLSTLAIPTAYTGDANASALYTNAGFYPYANTTGSSNYPTPSGTGIRIVSTATSTGRIYEMNTGTTTDSLMYFRKGIGSGNYTPWMAIASRSWVNTQLGSYVPINGSVTINDTKTFTNNVILKGGIIVDNATLAMRDFSGTGFKVSLTPPITVVGSDKIINIRDQSGTMALTSDISIQPIAVKSADYTLTVSDYTIVTGTLSTTYTLPAAASVPVGKTFVIKNFSSGSITVATTGTELKWNPASYITPVASLTGTISGWMLQTDGTYWYLITGD